MSNSLDPDQARRFVGPDLGPNCLQKCQQMTKVATSWERVKSQYVLLWIDKKNVYFDSLLYQTMSPKVFIPEVNFLYNET